MTTTTTTTTRQSFADLSVKNLGDHILVHRYGRRDIEGILRMFDPRSAERYDDGRGDTPDPVHIGQVTLYMVGTAAGADAFSLPDEVNVTDSHSADVDFIIANFNLTVDLEADTFEVIPEEN